MALKTVPKSDSYWRRLSESVRRTALWTKGTGGLNMRVRGSAFGLDSAQKVAGAAAAAEEAAVLCEVHNKSGQHNITASSGTIGGCKESSYNQQKKKKQNRKHVGYQVFWGVFLAHSRPPSRKSVNLILK